MPTNFREAVNQAKDEAKVFKLTNDNSLAMATTEALLAEKWKRDNFMVFPMDVFPSKMAPYINELLSKMHIPREFVGNTVLSGCSTAIGSSYVGVTKTNRVFLPLWGCNVGETSSGKSLVVDKVMDVFFEIDAEHSASNHSEFQAVQNESEMDGSGVTNDDYQEKKIIFQKGTFQSLVQRTLKNNPKGVLIMKDEFSDLFKEFGKKGYEEYEQFLLSAWSSKRAYKFEKLANRKETIIPRTFTNLIGGTQLELVRYFFGSDRDTSGFSARFLFAIDKSNKVLIPDDDFEPNINAKKAFDEVLRDLYSELPVHLTNFGYKATDPFECRMDRAAELYHSSWMRKHAAVAESLTENDAIQRETYKAALGKLNEYAIRFATILKVTAVAAGADFAYTLKDVTTCSDRYMEAACRLADFYMASYFEAYAYGNRSKLPMDAELVLGMMKAGKSQRMISGAMKEYFPRGSWSLAQLQRKIGNWMARYPKEFGTMDKR